jgi:predicted dehydrogenase
VGDWNRFSRNTGGTMVEKCCHFFDLMRLIVQSEAVRVYCSGAMDVNHLDERYDGQTPDIIDNSFTTVDFANGVRALLDLSMFAEGAENQEEVTAVGDKARLDVLIPEGALVYSPRVGFLNPKQVERSVVEVDRAALQAGSHHGSTFYQHQRFIAAVRGEGPVEVSARRVDGRGHRHGGGDQRPRTPRGGDGRTGLLTPPLSTRRTACRFPADQFERHLA